MNMAHGVETRPPFLDHELVSFCASLPADVKLRGQEDKHLLRQAMRGKLRSRHAKREKKACFEPTTQWLRTEENGAFLRETLRPENVRELGVFSEQAVAEALRVVLDEPTSEPQTLRAVRAEWLVVMAAGYQLLSERLMNGVAGAG